MKTRGKPQPSTTGPQPQKTQKQPKQAKSKSRPKVETKDNKKKQTINKKQEEKQQIKPQKVQQEKPNQQQEKPKQQQEKKGPKPKKYLNKNYDQLSRIARSQHQKIYLLQAERVQDDTWSFLVQGASGSNYRVHIHHTGLKCGCMDFRMKQKPCKHIYFIVTQVAQNVEILDYFNKTAKISKTAYKILDDQLAQRLKSRMQKKDDSKEKEDIDLKDDTDCTICFTEMNKNTEALEGCQTCKKYFHFECISAWKKHNATCPLCRSKLTRADGDPQDPLGKLQAIQIHTSQDANKS